MEKEEVLSIIEEIYSMPRNTDSDIQSIKEKIIEIGNQVDEQNIATVFKFICINAFAQSLK